ncbi:MAG: hypothetical protein AVDCRST_MAG48-3391, partial [uncultured Friedmanniella sp.]
AQRPAPLPGDGLPRRHPADRAHPGGAAVEVRLRRRPGGHLDGHPARLALHGPHHHRRRPGPAGALALAPAAAHRPRRHGPLPLLPGRALRHQGRPREARRRGGSGRRRARVEHL